CVKPEEEEETECGEGHSGKMTREWDTSRCRWGEWNTSECKEICEDGTMPDAEGKCTDCTKYGYLGTASYLERVKYADWKSTITSNLLDLYDQDGINSLCEIECADLEPEEDDICSFSAFTTDCGGNATMVDGESFCNLYNVKCGQKICIDEDLEVESCTNGSWRKCGECGVQFCENEVWGTCNQKTKPTKETTPCDGFTKQIYYPTTRTVTYCGAGNVTHSYSCVTTGVPQAGYVHWQQSDNTSQCTECTEPEVLYDMCLPAKFVTYIDDTLPLSNPSAFKSISIFLDYQQGKGISTDPNNPLPGGNNSVGVISCNNAMVLNPPLSSDCFRKQYEGSYGSNLLGVTEGATAYCGQQVIARCSDLSYGFNDTKLTDQECVKPFKYQYVCGIGCDGYNP
ncbi:MAG: hypothetical protein LBG46_02980, partial [Elusimicrobiota bacterium]|nr:hypothetical protein [Elusimicrobiota bacterium]